MLYGALAVLTALVGTVLPARPTPPVHAAGSGRTGLIAFRRSDDNIYTIDPAGSVKQLTHCNGNCGGLVWSPDGSWIAYETFSPDAVWVMNADGSNLTQLQLPISGDFSLAAWGPDPSTGGTQMALLNSTSTAVQLVHLTGLRVTSVSTGPTDPNTIGAPTFSPDGKQIAYLGTSSTILTNGNPLLCYYVANTDGSNPRQLLCYGTKGDGEGPSGPIAWSPDGKEILVVYGRSSNIGQIVGQIDEISPDGTGLHDLTNFPPATPYNRPVCDIPTDPTWGPDSQSFVFALRGYGLVGSPDPPSCAGLYTATTSGSGVQQIDTNPTDGSPVWQPTSGPRIMAVSLDGKPVTTDQSGATKSTDMFDPCHLDPSGTSWQDCSNNGANPAPDGTPDKTWPSIEVQNRPLGVDAQFYLPPGSPPLTNATVTGTVDVNGTTLTLTKSGLTSDQPVTATYQELLATGMQSGTPIPAGVSFQVFWTIHWIITAGGQTWDAGQSRVSVFVVAAAPVEPTTASSQPYLGTDLNVEPNDLDVVATSTKAANGLTDPTQIANAVGRYFADLSVHGWILDPVGGFVTQESGPPLAYGPSGWSLASLVARDLPGPPGYSNVRNLLQLDTGNSYAWSLFFADTLGVEGVAAQAQTAEQISETIADSPLPLGTSVKQSSCPGGFNTNCFYMLLDDWQFTKEFGGDYNYRYGDLLLATRAGSVTPIQGAQYVGSVVAGNVSSVQGGSLSAPGALRRADYAVVNALGQYWDPVHGAGPYSSGADWVKHELTGWAYMLPCTAICTLHATPQGHRP
jgi:Tol biopolymer transport system component